MAKAKFERSKPHVNVVRRETGKWQRQSLSAASRT